MVTADERVGFGGGAAGEGRGGGTRTRRTEAVIRYETQTHGRFDGNFIPQGSYRHQEAQA